MMRAILLALGASLAATSASAAVTTYADLASFNAAAASTSISIVTESFDNATLDTGVFSTASPSTALDGAFNLGSGRLTQVAGRGSGGDQFTTFNLAAGITAVSLELENFGGSEDVVFQLANAAGDSFLLSGPANFIGFISNSAITSFTINDVDLLGGTASNATLAVTEISAGIPAAVIPVPATLPLLLGALGVVGYAARRGRKSA
jgi:hypothetical protein